MPYLPEGAGWVGQPAPAKPPMSDMEEIHQMKVQMMKARLADQAAKQRAADQKAAAGKTETARQDATTALGTYKGSVKANQQKWASQHKHQYKTQQQAQTAWQNAWDNSDDGKAAKQALAPHLQAYANAAADEMRVAAENGGSDVNGAIQQKAADIKGRTDGKADHTQWEDQVLDGLIDGPDGVAAAITNETPAVRAANLEISRAFDDRDAALADVNTLEGQRTRDLKALNGTPGRFLREDVNESYSGQIAAARNNVTLAETNLRAALKTGLATIGAALVIADAKNNIKNLANSPALRNAAERQQTAIDLSAAEQQYRNVLAGDTELEVYTPEQVSTALNTLRTYHPELAKPENFPVAMDLMLDAGALTVKPELDAKLATLSVDANTPDWMKSLINDKGDKVTAALIVTLGVDGVKPQGRAEEILARDDPMAFAMLKYAGGSVPYPESNINGVEPTEADILKAGREATSTAVQNLALTTGKSADKVKSDQQDLMRLQLLIRASGDVRADYVQQQVTGLLAGQTAEAGVKRLLEDYLEGKDLSDLNWDPTTNGGKAMKIIKVNTEASFSADQAAQIWAQAGPEMTAYINKQANFIQTEYSHDDGYAAAIGEWQKHMGQFASPDGAKAIFTATTAISDPALIGRHGGGRMTDGLQVLADRDPETAANIAQWVTDPTGNDSWGISIRDLVTVKEDGTGIALGQAILDRMRSKGADEYALDDLQRTFDYGYKEAVQKHGEAARGEQFDLFNNDRNKKLQDIFDSAIAGTGDLYETKQKFGDDPIKDNAIGQAMHLAPDNPAAGTGQALYTDPAKLAQIHEVKQVNMIGDALQMGADRNGGLGEINYTDQDKLKRINKIRDWVADVGGGSALVSFLPAVYASARDGVSPMFLMRVEGDKNNDGVITRDRTTKMADDGYTSIPLADEDMILDTSMAGDAVAGQNVPVKYADFGAFQKENLLDDHGKLYMSGSDDMLLHDDDKDGHVDKINFNGTDAAITTAWEHVTEWGDRAVGVTAAVAGVALLVGSGGALAPVVLAGASIWGIYRTAETATQMSEHGQSFQPFKPGTKGAWLGLFDPVASGVLLGGIASVSGLAALKPLSLIRSFAPLGTSVEEAGTALRAAGMSEELVSRMGSNAGTELAGRYGIRSNLYRAGLADVPRPVALTAQISGAALLGGQTWSLTEAAINGEDFGKLGWDILLTGLGIGSYATGHVAGRMARSAAAADAAMPSQPSPRELAIRHAAALSGRDVAHLTGDEAAALPTDAVPAIAPDRFAQIGTDALGALTTEHVGAITGDQLEALPRNRLRELTIAQLKAIPSKLIPRIASGRLTAMRPDQIAALTLEQLAYLTVHQVAALTTDQLAAMTPEQLGAFTLAQRHALGPKQLRVFDPKPGDSAAALAYKQAQLKALSEPWQETAFGRIPLATDPHLYTGKEPLSVKIDKPVDHLTADELAAFSPQQLAAFTPEQKAALYPEQLELLDTAQIDAAASVGEAAPVTVEPVRFVPRLLHKLSGLDISKILPSDIGTVHPNRLMQLSFDQRTALTGEQIAAIRPRRLAQLAPHLMRRLTPDQVASFTREQMSWLTKAQVAAFTPDQLRALHPAQLATFSPEQRAALKPAQLRAFEPRPDDSPVVAEYRRAQAAALDTPWLETQYGAMSFADHVPHPYNNFASRTLTGLPPGRASSPVHEVANAYVGRSARVFGTRSGVEAAARMLHALKRNDPNNPTRIMLVTSFSVAKGMPETDGPPGTALLGHMLTHLGYDVTYVTDRAGKRVMQKTVEAVGDMREGKLETFSAPHFGPFASRRAAKLLDRINPDAVMTIELPGRNQSGVPRNMRGVITADFNPPLDEILNVANQRKGITTFAVGDGGNEAGLGRVRADEAGRPLGYIPNALDGTEMAAASTADYLITASVSNWGAEAVAAALAKRAGRTDLLTILDAQSAAIDASAKAGAVDGVTRFQKPSVDGFTKEAHEGWLNMLLRGIDATYMEPIYLGVFDSSAGGLYAARTMADYLTEITGRRLVRVLALDHANAPYGNPKYTSQDIGRMTNAPLKMLTRVLNGTASRQVLAMACNTACTGDGYDFGITVSVPGAGRTDTRVVDLVDVTAAKMIDPDIGGARPVSLSTSGTERSHAYRDAVRVLAPGRVEVTEIGASADPATNLDLATLVNRLNSDTPPSERTIRTAVGHYVDQMPSDATSVWLTCTHYPALRSDIEAALAERGMNIKVIDPMRYQAEATAAALGIRTVSQRPPNFQRSRPPVVITSGNPAEVLASARAVLGREDVRVIQVKSGGIREKGINTAFENVSEEEFAEIRHAIYRPNDPQDGTLHVLSVKDENGKWVPVETLIRKAEVEAYNEINKDINLPQAYENLFRAMAGYGPPGPASGKPSKGIWTQKLRLSVQEYAPWVATTATLAATVPVKYLVLANGMSWIVRGTGTLAAAIWPKQFAVGTKGGQALRITNALTFIGNGSYHGWTLTSLTGAPANQLYAAADHGSLAQNTHEARTGRTDGPSKWVKYSTLTAANMANVALMPVYSIPAGPLAWGPNLLFGGGTAYLTYKAMGGVHGGATAARVASGAVAIGLLAFGTHYVLTVALPGVNGTAPAADTKKDDTNGPSGDIPGRIQGPASGPGGLGPSPIPVPEPQISLIAPSKTFNIQEPGLA